jgi:hypothetical protein
MSKLDDLVKSIEKLARSPGDPMAHLATAVDLVHAYKADAEHFYAGTQQATEHVKNTMAAVLNRLRMERTRRAGTAANELFDLLSDEVAAFCGA